MIMQSDCLRVPSDIANADPRSNSSVVFGTDGLRPKMLDDHYESVAEITLHDGVPEQIRVQFETCRNLYLYSWFVYRFHPVAKTSAYACLELALRTRFGSEVFADHERNRQEEYQRQLKANPICAKEPKPLSEAEYRPGLQRLLSFAEKGGHLTNEEFSVWQRTTKARAQMRVATETIEKMKSLGLSEMAVDESAFEITDEDRVDGYLSNLVKNIPFLRNHHAHGTTALDDQSLSALRIVSEIINQVFPNGSTTVLSA